MSDPQTGKPILILREANGERMMPIWLGNFEANAIAFELKGHTSHLPLTHDLIVKFINSSNLELQHVVITRLEEDTYYAQLVLTELTQKDTSAPVKVDCRPSDAVALALKRTVPIFIPDELLSRICDEQKKKHGDAYIVTALLSNLLHAESLTDAFDPASLAINLSAEPKLLEELSKAAVADLNPWQHLKVRELTWLLGQCADTPVQEIFARRHKLVGELAVVLDASSWGRRDELLAAHADFPLVSPQTALVWIWSSDLIQRHTDYLWRMHEHLEGIYRSRATGTGQTDSLGQTDKLIYLVEDLLATPDVDEALSLLARYEPIRPVDELERRLDEAFVKCYFRSTLRPDQREYVSKLVRCVAHHGLAETQASIDRSMAALNDFALANSEAERTATLQEYLRLSSPESFAIISLWYNSLTMDGTNGLAERHLADQLGIVVNATRIARKYPASHAAHHALRKPDLTIEHLFRLLKADSRAKQRAVLKRHADTLWSPLAFRHLDAYIEKLAEQATEESRGTQRKLEVVRLLLKLSQAEGIGKTFSYFDRFDRFVDVLGVIHKVKRVDGNWTVPARGIHDEWDEKSKAAITVEEEMFDEDFLAMMDRIAPMFLEHSNQLASKFVLFGVTVERHFADNLPLRTAGIATLTRALTVPDKLLESLYGMAQRILAALYLKHGDKTKAEALWNEALQTYASRNLEGEVGQIYLDLAELYADWHDREDWFQLCLTHCQKALEHFDPAHDLKSWLHAMELQADAYREREESAMKERAIEIYDEMLARCDASTLGFNRYSWTKAEVCISLGKNAEAVETLRRAVDNFHEQVTDAPTSLRRGLGIPFAMIVADLAQLLLEGEPDDDARREALLRLETAKGRELVRDNLFLAPARPTPTELSPELLHIRNESFDELRNLYIMREADPESWDAVAVILRDLPEEYAGLIEEAAAEEQDAETRNQLTQARDAISELRYTEPEMWASMKKEIFGKLPELYMQHLAQVVSEIDGEESRLAQLRDVNASRLMRPAEVTWAQLTALCESLGDNAAIASYTICDGGISEGGIKCLVVRKGMTAPVNVPLEMTEEQFVYRYWHSYMDEALAREHLPGRRQDYKHSWQHLGEVLLAPLEPWLAGVEVLYIVPHQRLYWIPFHALLVDGQPYCYRRATVSIPALGYFAERVAAHPQQATRVASVGAIGYSREPSEALIFEGEAAEVAGYFAGSYIGGASATKEGLIKLLSETRGILHVSSHGEFGSSDIDDSHLKLADGEIGSRDWMEFQMESELCTFSACEVGRSQLSYRQAFGGFTRASLFGGAQAVLAPLWAVDARVAQSFCQQFYALTWSRDGQKRTSKAEGFRRALIAAAELTDGDPYLWASFLLTGDGR